MNLTLGIICFVPRKAGVVCDFSFLFANCVVECGFRWILYAWCSNVSFPLYWNGILILWDAIHLLCIRSSYIILIVMIHVAVQETCSFTFVHFSLGPHFKDMWGWVCGLTIPTPFPGPFFINGQSRTSPNSMVCRSSVLTPSVIHQLLAPFFLNPPLACLVSIVCTMKA